MRVREASDGESALAAVAEAPPDLILLDVMIPGLGEFAPVTQRLKSNPRTATIPIVLITALNESSDRLKGLAAGADEFLSRPVGRGPSWWHGCARCCGLKRLRDERQAVGDLGQRALAGVDLSVLLDEATALVADTLPRGLRGDVGSRPPGTGWCCERASAGRRARRPRPRSAPTSSPRSAIHCYRVSRWSSKIWRPRIALAVRNCSTTTS